MLIHEFLTYEFFSFGQINLSNKFPIAMDGNLLYHKGVWFFALTTLWTIINSRPINYKGNFIKYETTPLLVVRTDRRAEFSMTTEVLQLAIIADTCSFCAFWVAIILQSMSETNIFRFLFTMETYKWQSLLSYLWYAEVHRVDFCFVCTHIKMLTDGQTNWKNINNLGECASFFNVRRNESEYGIVKEINYFHIWYFLQESLAIKQ